MRNYEETLTYLYEQLPMYQRVGNSAFKKGLDNIIALCEALGNPQENFKSLHIAGTNGKGSSSHTLAAILQAEGYKVGLYTSPHLKQFTERIRVDGQEVSEDFVVRFVEQIQPEIESIQPSFFEITVAMAFAYFAESKVDYAVVEVGLGGRLDSTNILNPIGCLITNIGLDHTDMLGETLPEIAGEKAGIIKHQTPVVISEKHPETTAFFERKAEEQEAPLFFAEEIQSIESEMGFIKLEWQDEKVEVTPSLIGKHQQKNIRGVVALLGCLHDTGEVAVSATSIQEGIANVNTLTGLKGRWQCLNESPKVYCDVGHNVDGGKAIVEQLSKESYRQLYIVFGAVQGKDIDAVLRLLPPQAEYIFCAPTIMRALPANELYEKAKAIGLKAEVVEDVNEACALAKQRASDDDFIFIGGSTFVVAECDLV